MEHGEKRANPYRWGIVWKIWTVLYGAVTVAACTYQMTNRWTNPDPSTLAIVVALIAYPLNWWIWLVTWGLRRLVLTLSIRFARPTPSAD